jgi:hypothetical protein
MGPCSRATRTLGHITKLSSVEPYTVCVFERRLKAEVAVLAEKGSEVPHRQAERTTCAENRGAGPTGWDPR